MDFQNFMDNVVWLVPLLVLLLTALILMLASAFKLKESQPWIASLGIIASSVMAFPFESQFYEETRIFNEMLLVDGLASLIHVFLSVSALLTIFFAANYFERRAKEFSDVYALIVFALIGMIMLANANNLMMTFIGLEAMSVSLYIMAAAFKSDLRSNEAGLKYFLLGAFATGFILMGMSLIYGLTGTMNYSEMTFSILMTQPTLFYTAIALILVGFLFKVSAFPFHQWTPDVYSGTPTPFAGFMATGSKMATFIALGMFLRKTMPVPDEKLINVLGIIALATMVYGNFVAVQQKNIKRLLAYSSIAHSGYVLLGIISGGEGLMAAIFYMLIYTLMNIGAFGLVSVAETKFEDTELENWKGIGRKHPYFGGLMAVFLFSLAGIPPFAGFISKYLIFITAIESGYVTLAILGILTSVVAAYYYLKVLVMMFFKTDKENAPSLQIDRNLSANIGAWLIAVFLVLLGVYPSLIFSFLDNLFTKVPSLIALANF